MAIGSLTQLALELEITTIDGLRRESIESPGSQLTAAIELANRFRNDPAFAVVRSAECDQEVPFMAEMGGLKLHGIADLIGPDFVLDYKTDSEMGAE